MHRLIKLIILIFFVSNIETQSLSSSIINQCKTKLNQCQTTFFDELKQYKFNDYEMSYYKLCSSDGTYMRFVDCIRKIIESNDSNCQKQPLHYELCNKRGMKIFTYRYTWKSNLAHDICYRTTSLIDQDFFKHEKCISEVLNTPKWDCDLNHYEKTKKTNGLESCQHWKSFRQCIYDQVDEHCGKQIANVSDFLFHTHTSYFMVYKQCNLSGEPHTKCWLDLIDSIPRIPSPTTESLLSTTTMGKITTTTTTESTSTSTTLIHNITKTNAIIDEENLNKGENDDQDDDNSLITSLEQNELMNDNNNNKNNARINLIREAKISNHQNQNLDQDQEQDQYSKTTSLIDDPQQFIENYSTKKFNHKQQFNIIIITLFIIIKLLLF